MRPLVTALALGLAAAGMAYAHTADGTAPERPAGTLTCRTLPNVSLVFGRTRVAACTYVAQSGETRIYGAVLPPRADAEAAERVIVWRVTTAGGATRPGMLEGAFVPAEAGASLRGAAALLEPAGEAVEAGLILGEADARIELGALAPSAER